MMFPDVNTKKPAAVQAFVRAAYAEMYPGADARIVADLFGWVVDCFTGRHPDYLPIDAVYHDLEHTLQGALCMVRLLRNRYRAGAVPVLGQRAFELGLAAILLHDTGYLKTRDDRDGTGAKYTLTHVRRSAEFAARLLGAKGFSSAEIQSVQRMIACTGLDAKPQSILFPSVEERMVGFALSTGDFLGQMAATDYVDKLPVLFREFAEASRFNGCKVAATDFNTAEELMAKTPAFWERYVRPRIEREFEGLYRFLSEPYPGGPNEYIRHVDANVARLRSDTEVLTR